MKYIYIYILQITRREDHRYKTIKFRYLEYVPKDLHVHRKRKVKYI